MTVSKLLFVISNVARFHANFSLSIIVFYALLSCTLTITNPDISSMNGASTFNNFYSSGFNTIHSFEKNRMDLFKKL